MEENDDFLMDEIAFFSTYSDEEGESENEDSDPYRGSASSLPVPSKGHLQSGTLPPADENRVRSTDSGLSGIPQITDSSSKGHPQTAGAVPGVAVTGDNGHAGSSDSSIAPQTGTKEVAGNVEEAVSGSGPFGFLSKLKKLTLKDSGEMGKEKETAQGAGPKPVVKIQGSKTMSKPSQPHGSEYEDYRRFANKWDPLTPRVSSSVPPVSMRRIRQDIAEFYNDPPAGIFIEPDEKDMSLIRALIIGPKGTPYEGGFFHFLLRFPDDYPMAPPKVRIMTTNGGRVRFGPNLYECGKICLSILGTWPGPCWSPVLNLASVLISVQSLMDEYPWLNEPGYEHFDKKCAASLSYNLNIRYYTLLHAVCDNALDRTLPISFRTLISDHWPSHYDGYLAGLEKLKSTDTSTGKHAGYQTAASLFKSDVGGTSASTGNVDTIHVTSFPEMTGGDPLYDLYDDSCSSDSSTVESVEGSPGVVAGAVPAGNPIEPKPTSVDEKGEKDKDNKPKGSAGKSIQASHSDSEASSGLLLLGALFKGKSSMSVSIDGAKGKNEKKKSKSKFKAMFGKSKPKYSPENQKTRLPVNFDLTKLEKQLKFVDNIMRGKVPKPWEGPALRDAFI